jgi:hypothetical protein
MSWSNEIQQKKSDNFNQNLWTGKDLQELYTW